MPPAARRLSWRPFLLGSPPPYVPGNKYVQTKALSIDTANGSQVDLGNGAMILDYTGGASPLATVDAYITAAFNGGLWDLPGLTSSVAAADAAGTGVTTIGFLDNDQIGYDGITGAQFNVGGGGDAVPFNSVLVKYTYYGDSDLDGDVDADDLTNFFAGFDGNQPPTWLYGDFDYDNDVGRRRLHDLRVRLRQSGNRLDACRWTGR